MFDEREAALNLDALRRRRLAEQQHAAAEALLGGREAQCSGTAEEGSSSMQCGASNVWNQGDSPQVCGSREGGPAQARTTLSCPPSPSLLLLLPPCDQQLQADRYD